MKLSLTSMYSSDLFLTMYSNVPCSEFLDASNYMSSGR